jgi:hypothetical protein
VKKVIVFLITSLSFGSIANAWPDHGRHDHHNHDHNRDQWIYCADEGGYCQVPDYAQVAFGANGQFFYREVNGGIPCNNANFGDPIYGVRKACYYRGQLPPSGPTWTYCATESETCQVPLDGIYRVRYGANGRYSYSQVQDQVQCNNYVFGDPAPGTRKTCEYESWY